jgi:hypothetical protein
MIVEFPKHAHRQNDMPLEEVDEEEEKGDRATEGAGWSRRRREKRTRREVVGSRNERAILERALLDEVVGEESR